MSHKYYKPAKSRLQRSELAVPGSSPKMFEKALNSDADYIFLDLEDAVSPNDKVSARANVIKALNEMNWRDKGKTISGAANTVKDMLSSESRNTIYNVLGDDVKQAYLDYGNLMGLKEMGKTAMTGQKLKGGTGSFISDIISQAVTPVGTMGGQVIYKVGRGIEFLGNMNAKNVGQALGIDAAKLKFPGDAAVDDIGKSLSDVKQSLKNTPNKQGGFVKVGSDKADDLIAEAKKFDNVDEFNETPNKPNKSINESTKKL